MSTDQKEEGKRLSELNIDNNMCSSCLDNTIIINIYVC